MAVLCYGCARLGLLFAFHQTNVSPVWPPAGFALAAVLLRGYRIWPGILVGALLANAGVFHASGVADSPITMPLSAVISTGNTLAAVVAAFAFKRQTEAGNPLNRANNVVYFVFTALLMCLVSSVVGTISLYAGGIAGRENVGTIWITWWLGDVAGVLVVSPLLLTMRQQYPSPQPSRFLGEGLLFLALLLVIGQIVFGWLSRSMYLQYGLAFTLIPFQIWAAVRFRQLGVALTTVVITAMAVWGTVHHLGPFTRGTDSEALVLLQLSIGIVTITALCLAAVLCERAQAEEALRLSAESFRSLLESSPNAIIQWDSFARILLVNNQTETLFGYGRDELIGQAVDCLVPDRYWHGHQGLRDAFVLSPQIRAMGARRDLYGVCKDGSEVPTDPI